MSYPAPILNLNFANAKQLVHPAVAFSRPSQGSYFDSNEGLRYAPAGVPRFDHDPLTGICKGLLVEPSVTFLDTYSEQFDNAAWTKTRCSITADLALSPDGSMTSDKMIEDTTANASHEISQAISFTTGVVSCDVFLRAGERMFARVLLSDGATGSIYVDVNLSTGEHSDVVSSGSWTGASAEICYAGYGLYRVYISGVAASGTGKILTVYASPALGVVAYTGDGSSGIYIWGANIYAGSGPTSYLPTTSAGVTRAADVCSVDLTKLKDVGGNALWSGVEGTIVFDGEFIGDTPSSYLPVLTIDDGTINNRIGIYRIGSLEQIYATMQVSAVEQLSLTYTTSINPHNRFKSSFAFSENSTAMSVSGSEVQSDFVCSVPANTTNLRLCSDSAGNMTRMLVRSIKLYNRRIPDEYLPILSTL